MASVVPSHVVRRSLEAGLCNDFPGVVLTCCDRKQQRSDEPDPRSHRGAPLAAREHLLGDKLPRVFRVALALPGLGALRILRGPIRPVRSRNVVFLFLRQPVGMRHGQLGN